VIFPGERGVFDGLTGPRKEEHLIIIMWLKALAQNVAIYAVAGTIMVIILRIAKSLSTTGSVFPKKSKGA
jgi:hypothetical protein